jgi:hypothetical protein
MKRAVLLAAMLLAAAPAAAATGPGDFVRLLYANQIGGKHGAVWDRLHPVQQRFIPRKRFLACESDRFKGVRLKLRKIVVVKTRPEHVLIGGTATRTPATAVSIRLTAVLDGKTTTEPITAHVAKVAGRWRWILDQASALAYKVGGCPS